MRRRGRPEFEAKDLFMDFKGINLTLAVMARALIGGRIDCKTAGRLVVQLQTFSKLLWTIHRAKTKTLPLINTDNADLKKAKANLTTEAQRQSPHQARTGLVGDPGGEQPKATESWAANRREETRMAFKTRVLEFPKRSGWPHGPPEWMKAG